MVAPRSPYSLPPPSRFGTQELSRARDCHSRGPSTVAFCSSILIIFNRDAWPGVNLPSVDTLGPAGAAEGYDGVPRIVPLCREAVYSTQTPCPVAPSVRQGLPTQQSPLGPSMSQDPAPGLRSGLALSSTPVRPMGLPLHPMPGDPHTPHLFGWEHRAIGRRQPPYAADGPIGYAD